MAFFQFVFSYIDFHDGFIKHDYSQMRMQDVTNKMTNKSHDPSPLSPRKISIAGNLVSSDQTPYLVQDMMVTLARVEAIHTPPPLPLTLSPVVGQRPLGQSLGQPVASAHHQAR